MKSTGIIRKTDNLGRIVLPIEIRRKLGITSDDSVEIFIDEDRIVLRKYEPACIFCGNVDKVSLFKGKLLCSECINLIKKTK